MTLSFIYTQAIFAQASVASATSAFGGPAFMIQMLLLVGVFYFFMIRPQQQKAKEHAATINAVKKNDEVVTGGGLVGKVTKVDDATVEVEIASGVRVKVIKSTLVSVSPYGVKPAND